MEDLKNRNYFNLFRRHNSFFSVPLIPFPYVVTVEDELAANLAWPTGPDFLSKGSLEKQRIMWDQDLKKKSGPEEKVYQSPMPALKEYTLIELGRLFFYPWTEKKNKI